MKLDPFSPVRPKRPKTRTPKPKPATGLKAYQRAQALLALCDGEPF